MDYTMWWIACTYDLFMYTGDTNFVSSYYKNMVLALDSFLPSVTNTTTNLIDKRTPIGSKYGDYALLGLSLISMRST
jgi:glycogen debranching enzyme